MWLHSTRFIACVCVVHADTLCRSSNEQTRLDTWTLTQRRLAALLALLPRPLCQVCLMDVQAYNLSIARMKNKVPDRGIFGMVFIFLI